MAFACAEKRLVSITLICAGPLIATRAAPGNAAQSPAPIFNSVALGQVI
jgi:hypothetical protein